MNDLFYRAFEERFRGSRSSIRLRLNTYRDFISPLKSIYPDAMALDLGCGRGEWLEVLQEEGITPLGVDLDEGMLEACWALCLPAVKGDAMAYLANQPSNSLAIISAFHVVEHISFEQLKLVVSESLRILQPGGLLIMETPNPENIMVATRDFYLDPTHQRPLPPLLLSFLPEFYGFNRTKILRLQQNENIENNNNPSLMDVLAGASPDYAVVAQKNAVHSHLAPFNAAFNGEYGLPLHVLTDRYDAACKENEYKIKLAGDAAELARDESQQAIDKATLAEEAAHLAEDKAHHAKNKTQIAEDRANRSENEANQLRVNADKYINELSTVYASKSWRLTSPLRFASRLIRLEKPLTIEKSDTKVPLSILIRHKTRAQIARGIRYVYLRPYLRNALSKVLKVFPRLHKRLFRIAINTNSIDLYPENFSQIDSTTKALNETQIRSQIAGHFSGKKIAVLAPRATNNVSGGAERFYSGLTKSILQNGYDVDLITIEVDESSFENIQKGYQDFENLDLAKYDLVISTKAPSYAANHPNHILYLVHTVRVFYDMFKDVFNDASDTIKSQQAWIHERDKRAFNSIKHRFSIGAEVSNRLNRWNGCDAEVLHPPLDVEGLYDAGIGDYFYLPGRLHAWKRVDLAIRSIKSSSLPMRLLISGSGEAEEELRTLADNDPRIEFLGRVSDITLKDLYAGALAVPFLPLREDYGYVTLEAFGSGKPVITCMDSGEPNAFVENGVSGLVCEPTVESVKEAMETLWLDRDLAASMGRAGKERVSGITWSSVTGRLLKAGFPDTPVSKQRQDKLKVAILDMQPIVPAVGGGRIRLLGLYHALGHNIEARYVGTYDWPGEQYRCHQVAPGLQEVDIPLSDEHHNAAADSARQAGGKVVIDMLFSKQGHLSPAYVDEVNQTIRWADVVVFSHPWVAPLVSEQLLEGKMVVYDSQNVEGRLRAQILDQFDPFQNSVLEQVIRDERLTGDRSDLVLACSEGDAEGFVHDYNWNKNNIIIVPNGVFCESIESPTLRQKKDARNRLGVSAQISDVAFFIGSNYGPNIEAGNIIVREIAPKCPQVQFVIAGGVCDQLDATNVSNVKLVGFVDDSQRLFWLHAADFAINPMCSGSGTNIKMFDFMAASLPIVTTPIGARGIVDTSTAGIILAECDDMPEAIHLLLASKQSQKAAGIENRCLVEKSFSWEKISPRLGKLLQCNWMRLKGRHLLLAGGDNYTNRIAHLTTLGMKCGIGEYTKKIIDTYHSYGIKNFVLSCQSALESAVSYHNADQFNMGWYYDNKQWVGSYINSNAIEMAYEWGAQGMLVQYHPGFYSSNILLEFVRGCVAKGIPTAVVVHNYNGCNPVAFAELCQLGVSIFSHREEEVREAEKQGVELLILPTGVDTKLPMKRRDISMRDFIVEPPIIITNGFLRKHKGVRTLIGAMPQVLQSFPRAKLLVQCALYPSPDSDDEFQACIHMVNELRLEKFVVFDTKFLDKIEVLNILAKADIAVLPYDKSNEGGSASATDAFAVGLPLIVSDSDIFNEIRHVTATVEANAESVAKAVVEILSSKEKYRALAVASCEFAEMNSWEYVAGNFLTVFSNISGVDNGSESVV